MDCDIKLDTMVTMGLTFQAQHLITIVSIDASKCNDRVNQLMAIDRMILIHHIGAIMTATACFEITNSSNAQFWQLYNLF